MQFWALIVDSFRESIDRKIFWVMLLITLVVAGAMFCIGFQPGRIDILFGTWSIATDKFTLAGKIRPDFLAGIATEWIMDNILGWLAIILAVIATAGFLPSLMERGVIEVVLSKPLPRWKVFLSKYIGSLLFFAFHAVIFVALTFFIVGFRWGAWVPGYLLGIPLTVLLFSFLYCVSALVAVTTRSSTAAILITLGAWVGFAGIQSLGDAFEMYPKWKDSRMVYQTATAMRWVVPKTQDLTYIARKWSGAASPLEMMGDPKDQSDREMLDRASQAENARLEIHPVYSIGTSLLFETVVVLLAMWKFSRQDY
jgi:ABC-type transport system involved in multi-copper enzyme maturation permease subunit